MKTFQCGCRVEIFGRVCILIIEWKSGWRIDWKTDQRTNWRVTNMPRVKKNKEKIYDEFIREIRLNNLKTIKRIFNTADEVANCILDNYNYRCLNNEDFFTLRKINESVFDFSERKNINSDIIYTMYDMQHDYQRKLYWKIWFESFAKAFITVEKQITHMSKSEWKKYKKLELAE